jgi:hypothetical protein
MILMFAFIAPAKAQSNESPLELRNAMGTVLVSGLVGGVLGLSTLSFYDRPQDNIRNIFFGAGAGMILAAIVMTADVAQAPVPNAQLEDQNSFKIAPLITSEAAGLHLALKF